MVFNFFLLVSLLGNLAHPWGRIVVSTGSRDIVSMWQLEPHEKTFPHLDDIRRQIYDTLYEFDEKGNVKESLAESCNISSYNEDIENNVKIIMNCRIRPGVFFHDGVELTSRDVAFSINRLKTSKTLSSYFDIMENCVAPNNYSVTFTLKYKTPDVISPKEWLYERFKRILAKTGYIVRARYFEGNINWAIEYPVGTGPFYFQDWKIWDRDEGRSQIILSKNKSYWKKEYPKLDQLIFRFLPSAMWSEQIKKGFLSLVLRPTAMDYELFNTLNKNHDIAKTSKRLMFSYQYLLFSPYSKNFQSRDLKRALLNSVDRVSISKSLGSTAMINSGRALYASIVFPEKFHLLKYSPKEAREEVMYYLKDKKNKPKAGYKKGYININILVPDRAEELLVAEELRRQLYPVGFSVKINKLSSENYNIALNKKAFNDYDLILYSVDENPNYLTPNVRDILSYGGVQLYQRSLTYILSMSDTESSMEPYSIPLTEFMPPVEGPVYFFDTE
ncbi:MAG: ABC transporter substrate-binding protein [Proteobacteria bacterium]|nr:ABC transporter substrate-binding protein [Pseudomonadota bacterium]